jgi:hypothetical protein
MAHRASIRVIAVAQGTDVISVLGVEGWVARLGRTGDGDEPCDEPNVAIV